MIPSIVFSILFIVLAIILLMGKGDHKNLRPSVA